MSARPRILAVDDEVSVLEVLQATLSSEGYDVCVATSVAEFREQNSAAHFDLYIIDLTLPDGTGFALIRDLRPSMTAGIIILTGRDDETDSVLGLELGADDYVTKPFRPRELVARVNAVNRRLTMAAQVPAQADTDMPAPAAQTNDGPPIDHEFGGFKMSSVARQVWAPDGSEVNLTTGEFSVLLAIVERRGRVLSRDQIMSFAKGRDWESYDRAIDGVISRLRRKIVRADGSQFIRTVHGIGYIFGA